MPEASAEWFVLPDRIFDGHSVLDNMAVGVTGSQISSVVAVEAVPSGAPTRLLPGVTLTPGLIDAHVHLAPWMVFGLLAAGVTTVRDVGNDVDTVVPMLDRLTGVPLPTVHWSGPLLEGTHVNWPPISVGHETTDEIRSTVNQLAERGFGAIKLYANATPDLVAAASGQAHARGMRVLGHLGATGLFEAVDAGVDELQHLAGCLAGSIGAPTWPAGAEAVAAVPIDHCVTLIVWDSLAHLGQPRADRDRAMEWVPDTIKVAWSEAYHARQPAAERHRRALEVAEYSAAIPVLYRAGRTILVGSDSPFAGLIPGFALHDEAALLVEAGLTPLDAMRAVTMVNSQALQTEEVGRIEPGAIADLVAFDGDPTVRIADLNRVQAVWRGGVEIDLVKLADLARKHFLVREVAPIDRLAELRYTPATRPCH